MRSGVTDYETHEVQDAGKHDLIQRGAEYTAEHGTEVALPVMASRSLMRIEKTQPTALLVTSRSPPRQGGVSSLCKTGFFGGGGGGAGCSSIHVVHR